MRLLIVEDNEELAELLAKGLQTAGYQADVLSTVEEAKSVLSTTFYAALILDLGLPDGDGLALLRELRNRNDPIPVLVLTARGGLHDRIRGDFAGVSKDVVLDLLLRNHAALAAHQQFEDGGFARREQLWLIVDGGLAVSRVEFQICDTQGAAKQLPRTPQLSFQPCDELLKRKWLDQIVVSTAA